MGALWHAPRLFVRQLRSLLFGAGRPSEEGFTLIELMVVVVVLPVIFAGVSVAVITSLQDDTGVSTRLAESHDAQITSAYFVRDVESASKVWAPSAPSTPLCGSGTQILGLEWNLTVGTPTYVSYVTKTVGSAPALVRNFCGSSDSSSIVSHNLGSASNAAAISLLCNAGYSCTVDAASTPVTSLEIDTVTLDVTEASSYQFTLSASPRQSSTTGSIEALPPGASPPTLLLLGSKGVDAACAGSGHGSVTVDGTAAVDSASTPSVTLGSNITATAGQIYGGASGTESGGTYVPTSTVPTASGPPIPDPYANLSDPNPVTYGLTTYTGTYSKNNPLPGPGVYTQMQNVTWNQTLTSGIYIFEGGFTAGGSPGTTIDGTAGVLLFIGIPNASPSIVQTAAFSIAGNNIVKLAPLPSPSPYDGLVIFQSRTDPATVSTSGNGTSSFSAASGAIYAPDAAVNTSGNGTTVTAGIISQTLACGGNGSVTLGSSVSTSVALTSVPAVPSPGQSVTFTAALGAADGLVPSGTMTFTETPNGSSTAVSLCSVPVPTNGRATCTTSSLVAAGSPYTIKATYGGNATFQAQTSSISESIVTPTTSNVTAAPPTPTTGQSVVLTDVVSPTPDAGSVTWSITFGSSGSTPCSSTTALTGGTATCTIAAGVLAAANSPYSVMALYGGDAAFSSSAGTTSLVVSAGPDTTIGAPSATSVSVGNPVDDVAAVTGAGPAPSGSVTFYVCVGATTGCDSSTGTLFDTETLGSGSATSIGYTPAAAGSYCFAAYYGGDTNYVSSSDTTPDQCFTAS